MDTASIVIGSRMSAAGARLAWIPIGLALLGLPAAAETVTKVRVPREKEIAQAMAAQKRLGYDLRATANGARLSAAVILHFAQRDPSGADALPFVLDHREYFEAYLKVAGVERDKAPTFVRMANQFGEDQFVDTRRHRVIERVVEGPQPKIALNVVTGWPAGPGAAAEYTYSDEASNPPLKVTHKRVTSYRLLDFGDAQIYDEVQGVFGRATGGMIGAMFSVMGDGRAVRSFMGYAADGVQVIRTTAAKGLLQMTQTVSVTPEGRGYKGLLSTSPDSPKVEGRLKQPFKAAYVPIQIEPSDWIEAKKGAR